VIDILLPRFSVTRERIRQIEAMADDGVTVRPIRAIVQGDPCENRV